MAENRSGTTLLPQMAIDAGILTNTALETRPLESPEAKRTIALAWRPSSPRADEYRLLAQALKDARP
jgi:LysR family hydrogen peroxide-inducible transcriptional activator